MTNNEWIGIQFIFKDIQPVIFDGNIDANLENVNDCKPYACILLHKKPWLNRFIGTLSWSEYTSKCSRDVIIKTNQVSFIITSHYLSLSIAKT